MARDRDGANALGDDAHRANSKPAFTFIECFCGIGGFRLGLEKLGGRCVWACESDRDAIMTYEANFGNRPYHDIRACDPSKIPKYDMLTGGFPCQDFTSLATGGLSGMQQGLDGARGSLFFELIRILQATRPPLLFLENVRGLVTMEGGAAIRRVIEALEKVGYTCRFGLRNSEGVLPQFRRRCFIFGFRDAAAAARFVMPASPTLSPRPSMADALEDPTDPFLRHYTLSSKQWRRVKQCRAS